MSVISGYLGRMRKYLGYNMSTAGVPYIGCNIAIVRGTYFLQYIMHVS